MCPKFPRGAGLTQYASLNTPKAGMLGYCFIAASERVNLFCRIVVAPINAERTRVKPLFEPLALRMCPPRLPDLRKPASPPRILSQCN